MHLTVLPLLAILMPLASIYSNSLVSTDSKKDKPEWATNWRKKKLYLVGSTHNVDEQVLASLQMNIDVIGGLWENMQVIIYGDTPTLTPWRELIKARRQTNYVFIDQQLNLPSDRIERIVVIRNTMLDKMRELIAMYQEPHRSILWCQIDLDAMMKYTFHSWVIESSMNQWRHWDAISYNRPFYYDIWALRYEKYDVNVWDGRPMNESWAIISEIRDDIGKQLKKIQPMFPVYSAFNGLAFYKYRYVKECYYWKNGTYDMEHQEFHRCLRNNGARFRIWSEYIVNEIFYGHP